MFQKENNSAINKAADLLQVRFSLRVKFALALVLTTFLSSPISQFINYQLGSLNFFSGTVATYTTALINLVVAVIVMLFLCRFLILRHIQELVLKIDEIAGQGGDLTRRINIKTGDELEALGRAINRLIESVSGIVVEIKASSEQLASHSQELASSSEEVSAAVQQVVSTTHEMAATSSQGAENAETAAGESELVMQVAEDGRNAVMDSVDKINSISTATEKVSGAIERLGHQSKQIGEIISTITTIAEQTNLLALNAAIEAARAGEHGRGFAVVAEEVRNLAEQSAEAANKITGLINRIEVGVDEAITAMELGSSEVEKGVQTSHNAGAALQQIISAVKENTDMIRDVAAGAHQANEGAQQLTAAGDQINLTVQQVSGAAQELANIADNLHSAVARFKVNS